MFLRNGCESNVRLTSRLWPASRAGRIWRLAAIVFSLHGVLDPAITYLAVEVLQVGVEANPFLRRQLAGGPWQLAIAHVLLGVFFAATCWGVITLMRRGTAEEAADAYRLARLFLFGMILWGVGLICWNTHVILQGV